MKSCRLTGSKTIGPTPMPLAKKALLASMLKTTCVGSFMSRAATVALV